MKTKYLWPHIFKKIGWIFLIPSSIIGFISLVNEYEPRFLDLNVPAIFVNEIFREAEGYGMITNNILNEILGILIIVSSLLVAFSKEKQEDEYISKIRLESLVWAVYVNYGILILTFLFIYDMSFFWVMIFNMFTVLLFFIVRFNLQLLKLNKSANHEE